MIISLAHYVFIEILLKANMIIQYGVFQLYMIFFVLFYCCLLYTSNYGPYHFPEKLIPLVILNSLEGKALPIYGKGDQIRDWLYVEAVSYTHLGYRTNLRAKWRSCATEPARPYAAFIVKIPGRRSTSNAMAQSRGT